MSGWIKLHRSSLESPALASAVAEGVWSKLLLMAAHKPCRVPWRGQSIELDRGQLAISVRERATLWGLTHKQLRTILDRFEREGMIQQVPILGTVKGTGRGTVGTRLTICKYCNYQDTTDDAGTTEGTVAGTTGAQQGHTEQEPKNITDTSLRSVSDTTAPALPSKPKRGSRLPEEFAPDLAEAGRLGLTQQQVRIEAERFRDYWRAAPGQRGVKADWPATWRNWCRRAAAERPTRDPPRSHDWQQDLADDLIGDRHGPARRTAAADFDRGAPALEHLPRRAGGH